MREWNKVKTTFIGICRDKFDSSQIFIDAPMRLHTTFCIGGPADLLFYPKNIEEVQQIIQIAVAYEQPITLLGNGSNILVQDGGIRGLVIRFSSVMSNIRREGMELIIGAGALLKDVSFFAQKNGLSGIEFACGIPGSIGGAVFMNAGAYDSEMKSIVTEVKTVSVTGEIHSYTIDELEFEYRHSIFHKQEEAICEIRILLKEGNADDISKTVNDLMDKRKNKQPLEFPSAGSTFKRPTGYFAGTLIDQTGLKGLTIGGAQVSQKHAGFIINIGGATAYDVQQLITSIQKFVHEKHGVKLIPELRIIGEP